jgi:hypothetical protein
MLSEFTKKGKIDASQLDLMDNIIKMSAEDQFRVLNRSSLSLDAQRSFFGAIRNVNIAMASMKAKLAEASVKHENPTTAELALELLPSVLNLVPYIDEFHDNAKVRQLNNVSRFSRILYKKAKTLGFSKDRMSQLKEAGVTTEQVEAFIDSFDKNVALELDMEEEVSSSDEDSNRDINAS